MSLHYVEEFYHHMLLDYIRSLLCSISVVHTFTAGQLGKCLGQKVYYLSKFTLLNVGTQCHSSCKISHLEYNVYKL